MSEYELSDLVASNMANMYMDTATFLTLFSGYIVVTYLLGDKLTRFQAVFISVVFLGLAARGMSGIFNLIGKNLELLTRLHELNPQRYDLPTQGMMSAYVYLAFRTLVVLGCFIFMWQVRHGSKKNLEAS